MRLAVTWFQWPSLTLLIADRTPSLGPLCGRKPSSPMVLRIMIFIIFGAFVEHLLCAGHCTPHTLSPSTVTLSNKATLLQPRPFHRAGKPRLGEGTGKSGRPAGRRGPRKGSEGAWWLEPDDSQVPLAGGGLCTRLGWTLPHEVESQRAPRGWFDGQGD